MRPVLETDRLALRPWRDGDKPAFAAIMNTPAVMRHLGGVTTREVLDALVESQMEQQAAHGLSMWAAVERKTGTLLGICGLRYGGHSGTPVPDELEIGWRLAEHAWGRGYAREAAEAAIAWGWLHTSRPRIAAWTAPANRASWGLMLRLGMNHRPELDFDHPRMVDGQVLRLVTYAIDRPAA